jgi:hypothetical protein
MKLRQIASNMTELVTNGCTILFSYKTPVAAYTPTQGYVRTAKWYSQTTTRHINKWLRSQNAEAEERSQEFFDSLIEG